MSEETQWRERHDKPFSEAATLAKEFLQTVHLPEITYGQLLINTSGFLQHLVDASAVIVGVDFPDSLPNQLEYLSKSLHSLASGEVLSQRERQSIYDGGKLFDPLISYYAEQIDDIDLDRIRDKERLRSPSEAMEQPIETLKSLRAAFEELSISSSSLQAGIVRIAEVLIHEVGHPNPPR